MIYLFNMNITHINCTSLKNRNINNCDNKIHLQNKNTVFLIGLRACTLKKTKSYKIMKYGL